jgi:peptidoglycan/LPS O-acetylase OafA/YrhL
MRAKSVVYFPNLNGLRFVAAAAVIVHHTEQIKWRFGVANIRTTSASIALIGKLGVLLFLVPSPQTPAPTHCCCPPGLDYLR